MTTMRPKEGTINRPWALLRFLLWAFALLLVLGSGDAQQFLSMKMFKKSSDNFGSTVLLPVGGRVYPDGYFYATLYIGQPPKPFYFDIDTGSDLTWVQCDAPCVNCVKGPHPPYKPSKDVVLCNDPFCSLIQHPSNYPCQNSADQCDYEIEYADHGSSLGVLLKDRFHLQLANRSKFHQPLTFGCGYDQVISGSSHSPYVDGVLGLANGKPSILSQLREVGVARNVVAHCFSSKGGGYLLLGDRHLPTSGVVWVPMAKNSLGKYYTIGPADLHFDGQKAVGKGLSFIFDSGSTFTYLKKEVYKSVISAIKENLDSKQLKDATEDKTLPICFKGTKPFKSINDVKGIFKTLAVRFKNSKSAILEMLPKHYLIINEKGNVCIAILNGSEAGLEDLNVLGDVSLQDRLVIYDNEKRQIGWISESCEEPPNDGLSGFFNGDKGASVDAPDEL